MAHDLAVIDGRAAMAYLGEAPWHRLGCRIDGEPALPGEGEVARAMRLARLDWGVGLEPMLLRDGAEVPDRRAVVRDLDRQVLGVVGMDYVPLQNSEAFGALAEACAEHGARVETAGALGRGERVWMLLRLPAQIEAAPGDRVDGYALVLTGHDGRTLYHARLTPVRVVCANTLAMALRDGQTMIRLRHVRGQVEQVAVAGAMVSALSEGLAAQAASWRRLAARRLTLAEASDYVDAVLGIEAEMEAAGALARRRSSVLDLVAAGRGVELAPGTAWAAYNAVTEHVDHARTARSPRVLANADRSALFGPGADLKARALRLALELID